MINQLVLQLQQHDNSIALVLHCEFCQYVDATFCAYVREHQ